MKSQLQLQYSADWGAGEGGGGADIRGGVDEEGVLLAGMCSRQG